MSNFDDPIARVLAEAAHEHRGIPNMDRGMIAGYRCACGARPVSVTAHRSIAQAAALRAYFASEGVRAGLWDAIEEGLAQRQDGDPAAAGVVLVAESALAAFGLTGSASPSGNKV